MSNKRIQVRGDDAGEYCTDWTPISELIHVTTKMLTSIWETIKEVRSLNTLYKQSKENRVKTL